MEEKARQRRVCLGICDDDDLSTPIHMYRMWRPAGGRWVEGETKLPWEEEKQESRGF